MYTPCVLGLSFSSIKIFNYQKKRKKKKKFLALGPYCRDARGGVLAFHILCLEHILFLYMFVCMKYDAWKVLFVYGACSL